MNLGFRIIPRNAKSSGQAGSSGRATALWRQERRTMILAMQSSVVSAVSHSIFPPLFMLHSSHLPLSMWPIAHHFTFLHSFFAVSGSRAWEREPGVQMRHQKLSASDSTVFMKMLDFASNTQTDPIQGINHLSRGNNNLSDDFLSFRFSLKVFLLKKQPFPTPGHSIASG